MTALAYLYPEHLGRAAARRLQMAATLRALARCGTEVHLVVGWFPGLERCLTELGLGGVEGLRVHPVAMFQSGRGMPLPLSWHGLYHRAAWGCLRRLAGQGVRLVLVRHLKLAHWLLSRRRELGLKLIYEAHELFGQTAAEEGAPASKRARLEIVEREVLAGTDLVVTVSQPLAQALAREGLRQGPVVVAPAGVAEEFFAVSGEGRREELVAYAGGLMAWKGVDLLLEAVARLPQVRLEVLGGERGSSDWRRLEELAARLELGGRLRMRPRAGQEEVRRLLGRAAVAVWPGTARGRQAAEFTSPLKLFEYLAAGCAVVAPRVPAAVSLLREGEHALLFRPDDPSDLAQAIARLLDDTSLRARLATAGRTLARNYTWSARARRILEGLEALVE
jgi:glycosyltransferase involved in cell wall biosynthesis